jgi:DNA-binding CsgD family transcriptional regulator
VRGALHGKVGGAFTSTATHAGQMTLRRDHRRFAVRRHHDRRRRRVTPADRERASGRSLPRPQDCRDRKEAAWLMLGRERASMSLDPKRATPTPGTGEPGSNEVSPFVGSLLSPWDDRNAQPGSGVDTLTAREREVLAMISQGSSNKHIARALEIAPETVKSHVKHIFLKLAVSTAPRPCFELYRFGCCDVRSRSSPPAPPPNSMSALPIRGICRAVLSTQIRRKGHAPIREVLR